MRGDADKLWEQLLSSDEAAECRAELGAVRSGSDKIALDKALTKEEEQEEAAEQEEASGNAEDLLSKVKDMSVPEKIKLALFGNKAARSLLIRDRNRQVPLFVLQNSRISEEEIVEIAKNTNIDELVFRAIANDSTWMKNYAVKLALVSNPRVPIDISLRWLKYLHDSDLRNLSRSRNISQVVATQCRKLMEKRQ